MKKSLYLLAVVLVGIMIFLQLKSNKSETAKVTALATVIGHFYPVEAMVVELRKINSSFETTGFLQSETDLNVLSEIQGTIQKIYKEKGDYVVAGDVIAKVDDELLAAQFSASKAAYKQMEKEVDRFTKLYAQSTITSQKLEEIKLNYQSAEANYISANRQLEDTKIKAPVSGFIEDDFIEVGLYISKNEKICNIIDAQKLKLNIAIPEQDYQGIKMGQTVEISSSIYPTTKFEGHISFIGKKAGFGNTFDADIRIVNDNSKLLKAGMFVSAIITHKQNTPGIYIPRKAINGSLKDASVYTIEDGLAISKKVIIGNVVNSQVQIVKGLSAGIQVVIKGNYNIFEGAKVKIMNE